MHISGNIRPQIRIKGRLIFSSKFAIFGDVTRGAGVSRRQMTTFDRGEGNKKFHFEATKYSKA